MHSPNASLRNSESVFPPHLSEKYPPLQRYSSGGYSKNPSCSQADKPGYVVG